MVVSLDNKMIVFFHFVHDDTNMYGYTGMHKIGACRRVEFKSTCSNTGTWSYPVPVISTVSAPVPIPLSVLVPVDRMICDDDLDVREAARNSRYHMCECTP